MATYSRIACILQHYFHHLPHSCVPWTLILVVLETSGIKGNSGDHLSYLTTWSQSRALLFHFLPFMCRPELFCLVWVFWFFVVWFGLFLLGLAWFFVCLVGFCLGFFVFHFICCANISHLLFHLSLWLSQSKLFGKIVIQSFLQLIYEIYFKKITKISHNQSPCAIWLIKYYAFCRLNSFNLFDTLKDRLKEFFNLKLFNFVKSLSVVFFIFHGHMVVILSQF